MTTLPLTPLEAYLLHDDVPAYPCWQFARMMFRGTFQREPLERAWRAATARHPLWHARVARGPLGLHR